MRRAIHLPDAVILPVGNEQVTSTVHGDANGIVEGGAGSWTVIAIVAPDSDAGNGGNDTSDSVHAPYPGGAIYDKQVTAAVQGDALLVRTHRQPGTGGGAVIAALIPSSVSCHRCD